MRSLTSATAALLLLFTAPLAARPLDRGTIESDAGISLFYEKIGNGPNLVIVPGRFLFSPHVARLARPDRTIVLYDMRNRGRSSSVTDDGAISIHADVRDLEAVRRHFGAEQVTLVGYSYLGLMTALYAIDHPERVARLVQIGPVPIRFGSDLPQDLVWRDPAPVLPAAEFEELRALRETGFDRTSPRDFCLRQERLTRRNLVGNPARAELIDVERRCASPNEWPVNLRRHLQIHFTGSVQNLEVPHDALRTLQVPVLTIHGIMDRNAPLAGGAQWAMTLPNARLRVVPGAAHQVWADAPRIFAEIDAFLSGEWPPAAAVVRSWDDVRRLVRDESGAGESVLGAGTRP